jgi:hypothetical protein
MAFIIGILLGLFSLSILVYPFLKTRYLSPDSPGDEDLEDLARARSSLMDEMERLALDLDVGNITEQQYQEGIAPLRRAAALSLRQEDQLKAHGNGSSAELDQVIEKRIRLLRQSVQKPTAPKGESPQ